VTLIARQRLLREQEAQKIAQQRQQLEVQALAQEQEAQIEQQAAMVACEERIAAEESALQAINEHQVYWQQYSQEQNVTSISSDMASVQPESANDTDKDAEIRSDADNVVSVQYLPVTTVTTHDSKDDFELYLQRSASSAWLNPTRIALAVTVLIAGLIFWWWTSQPTTQIQAVTSPKKATPQAKGSSTAGVDSRVGAASNVATKDAAIFEPKLDRNFEKISPKK
jgi:hypothetical protein